MKQILLVMCLVIGLNTMGEEQNTFTIFDNPEYFPELGKR